jgi:hypothetical protein
MQKQRFTLVASVAYAALLATLVISSSLAGAPETEGRGQPSGANVRVINKTTHPVPVTLQGTGTISGGVNILNSPTVNLAPGSKVGIDPTADGVTVENAVSLAPATKVGIDPAADGVTIKNADSDPVPVAGTFRNADEPGRNPHHDGTGSVVASNSFTTEGVLSSVPAGKQLVMEYFSATAIVPAGQTGFFFVTTRAGGVALLHHVPVIQKFADAAFPGSDLLVAAQSVRIYADPGTAPSVSFRRSSNAGPSTFNADISGYFVNL